MFIGSPIFGKINDRFGGGKAVSYGVLITVILTFLTCILNNELQSFGIITFFMTFLLGFYCSALLTQINLILGFEFSSNVEPFVIYRLICSFGTCLMLILESVLITINSFRAFFIGALVFCVCSQISILKWFQFKDKKGPENKVD